MTTAARITRWRKDNPERQRAIVTRYRLSRKGIIAHLWKGAKYRALKRGLEFSLTKACIAERLLKGKCEVSGIAFVRKATRKIHPFAPSIDRVDYRKGYTDENIRLVIFAFNAARGHWGDKITLRVAQAIVQKLGGD